MKAPPAWLSMLFFAFISVVPPAAVNALETSQSRVTSGGEEPGQSMDVQIELHDLELLTQDGRRVRFKSDVIGDRLVAITFIYTTCTTICPIFSSIFGQLQNLLGERMGREVVMISLSLNPTTDIPARMKREAQKHGARPGWFYLTGEKQNVVQVLKGLDAYFPDFEQHPPMALVGDGRTGMWRRFNGFPRPEELLALMDELTAARGKSP
ncbi:MAG: SCO family protein [Syntrophobacteraceae bacterium]|nr:SCO family protein [Syntrophobacteraceae bacterium]